MPVPASKSFKAAAVLLDTLATISPEVVENARNQIIAGLASEIANRNRSDADYRWKVELELGQKRHKNVTIVMKKNGSAAALTGLNIVEDGVMEQFGTPVDEMTLSYGSKRSGERPMNANFACYVRLEFYPEIGRITLTPQGERPAKTWNVAGMTPKQIQALPKAVIKTFKAAISAPKVKAIAPASRAA